MRERHNEGAFPAVLDAWTRKTVPSRLLSLVVESIWSILVFASCKALLPSHGLPPFLKGFAGGVLLGAGVQCAGLLSGFGWQALQSLCRRAAWRAERLLPSVLAGGCRFYISPSGVYGNWKPGYWLYPDPLRHAVARFLVVGMPVAGHAAMLSCILFRHFSWQVSVAIWPALLLPVMGLVWLAKEIAWRDFWAGRLLPRKHLVMCGCDGNLIALPSLLTGKSS